MIKICKKILTKTHDMLLSSQLKIHLGITEKIINRGILELTNKLRLSVNC